MFHRGQEYNMYLSESKKMKSTYHGVLHWEKQTCGIINDIMCLVRIVNCSFAVLVNTNYEIFLTKQ